MSTQEILRDKKRDIRKRIPDVYGNGFAAHGSDFKNTLCTLHGRRIWHGDIDIFVPAILSLSLKIDIAYPPFYNFTL